MHKDVKMLTFNSPEDLATAISVAEGIYLLSLEDADGKMGRKNEFIAHHLFNHEGAEVTKR